MFSSKKKRARARGPLANDADLRNNLQNAIVFDQLTGADGPKVIGVCGCHAGAGATSLALGLSVMLQERTGDPVVLVEANLRNPKLSNLYDLTNRISFSDLIHGRMKSLSDLVTLPETEVWVIPGDKVDAPLQLMNHAKRQLQSLGTCFRHVIVTFPPILSHVEVSMVAPALDGVVLVLEAEETNWHDARKAKKRLDSAGAKLLGVIINKQPQYIPKWINRLL